MSLFHASCLYIPFPKNSELLDSDTIVNLGSENLLFPCEESSFLMQCHLSAHCPGLRTPCLHCTSLPSFDQQIQLDGSNNAPPLRAWKTHMVH